ncbi:MAG: hypothetical protein IPK32_16810 [Verrucomicrobiaceae bacterium]|nr:hypothetical protein [Verrucomicrobiaceae bacterium]
MTIGARPKLIRCRYFHQCGIIKLRHDVRTDAVESSQPIQLYVAMPWAGKKEHWGVFE